MLWKTCPGQVSSQKRGNKMGNALSKEEEAVEKFLQAILYRKDPNYDSSALRELLKWSKSRDLIPTVSAAFEVSTWVAVGQKLWDETSRGSKEVKKFPAVWRLLVDALEETGAERQVSLSARAVLDGGSGAEAKVSESKTSADQFVFGTATTPILMAPRKQLGLAPAAAGGAKTEDLKAGAEPGTETVTALALPAAPPLPAVPALPVATSPGGAPASAGEPAQSVIAAGSSAPAPAAPPAVTIAHASGTEPAVTSSTAATTNEVQALTVASSLKCHLSQTRKNVNHLIFGTPGQPPGPRVRSTAAQRAARAAAAHRGVISPTPQWLYPGSKSGVNSASCDPTPVS